MIYTIGQPGKLTGTTVPTIRYYEGIGLRGPVGRSEGGQRRYDEPAQQRLGFIRHARDMGFPLDAIRHSNGYTGGELHSISARRR